MATLTWDAVGGDPAPGDPGAYDELAQSFSQTAADAADARRKLDAFSRGIDDSIWRGESATAFKDKIGKLPGRLEKLHSSYSTASEGMAAYGRSLRDLQQQARAALGQAQGAQDDKAAQERSRDQARSADPSTPTTGHDDAIDAAGSRINDARNRLDDIRDRRRAAESTAVGRFEAAQDLGIANDSMWKRAWDSIDSWVDEHADILKKLSAALKVISAIAGVLSFIPFLAPIMGPIALVAGGLALLTDAALAATGNGSWKMLLVDAALMALPGAGALLRAGLRGTRVAAAGTRAMGRVKGVGGRVAAGGRRLVSRVTRGDPIDVATGEVVMSTTDVELAGALPLVFTRTYVSSSRVSGGLRRSWFSTFDQMLEIGDDGICFASADGMVLTYPNPDSEAPVLPERGPRWPLARAADGGRTIVDPETGRTLHFAAVVGSKLLPLSAITDRNGHRIDLRYGPGGALAEIHHHGGYRVRVETSDGLIAALHLQGAADDGGDLELVRYRHDGDGHLTEVVNSSGAPLRFEYDPAGRLAGWIDRNGCWYRYTYDDEGRCIRTEGAGGCLDGTYEYDRDAGVTVSTDALGHATTFGLNDLSQVVREVDALGNVTMREWDVHDRLLARTDPLGRTTRWAYDADGNLVGITRPDGSRTQVEYNELRLPVTFVEPDGAAWRQGYDGRGNLVVVTDPMGATTSYAYDERGHLTAATDALGQVRRVETDGAGLPVAVSDGLGATMWYGRDALGRVDSVTDPLGGVVRVSWTIEGRLARVTAADGSTERWTYDGEGNLVAQVDALGQVTRTEIGDFDMPAAQIGPDGARLELTHDPELRLVAVTNPQGLVWRYDYDPAGNLLRETDFNGRVLTYGHDGAGQLASRTNGVGQTTHLVRDVLGRVIEQRRDQAATRFDYDAAGRLVRAVNPDADLVFDRDPLGRVVAETCNGRAVTSTYDAIGRRVRRRTPSGADSAWEYDANHRPVALHTAGRTLDFGYDVAGREVERLLGAGTTLAQTWDPNHRLTSQSLTAAGADTALPASARQARLVAHRSYRYRPDGYVTDIDDLPAGNRVFDLDAVGHVTAVHGAGWSERYAYDLAGNVTHAVWPASPATDGAADADVGGEREYAGTLIRRAGRVRYEHDAQGRVVLSQQPRLSARPRTWHYSWDAEDRLVAVTTPDGQRWRYRYDALGRRISKQCLAGDGRVVEQVEFTWDGTILAEQVHTGGGGADLTTVWDWEPGTFSPVSQTERVALADAPQDWVDQRFYAIVTDLIGTPSELVDPDGTVAWRARSTLWGRLVDEEAGGASCPLRFPGQYHDAESGLSYNFHRYYEPANGRYGSADPLGLAPSPNPHAYVPNPTGWTDPLGLVPYERGSFAGGGDDVSRVGRWMSPEEHLSMLDDGMVQPGRYSPHTDVAHPADVEAYMRSAKPGSRYVEFDVPSSSLVRGGKEGWAHIPGPDSIFSRLAQRQGRPPYSYPPATNIEWLASRIRL